MVIKMSTFGRLLLLLLSILMPSGEATRSIKKHKVPGMFIFGDSLADAGSSLYFANSTAPANFPPYGETYFHKPTGRYSDGRLVVDFIAQHFGLPLIHPFLQPNASFKHGANFASAGSGLLESTNPTGHVVSFTSQIQQFTELSTSLPERLGNKHAQKLIAQAIYYLSSGGNDIGLNYLTNSSFRNTTSPEAFVTLLLEEFQEGLLALYKVGGRKFLVVESGPVGCTPNFRFSTFNISQGACYEPANQLALAFNTGLKDLVDGLTKSLPGVTVVYGRVYDFVMGIINHGVEYGFTNTTAACCGAGPFNTAVSCGVKVPSNLPYEEFLCSNPAHYTFWDGTHPTEHTYRLVFDRLWSGNTSAVEPMNIKSLANLTPNA